jgi:hypothetical protein
MPLYYHGVSSYDIVTHKAEGLFRLSVPPLIKGHPDWERV